MRLQEGRVHGDLAAYLGHLTKGQACEVVWNLAVTQLLAHLQAAAACLEVTALHDAIWERERAVNVTDLQIIRYYY